MHDTEEMDGAEIRQASEPPTNWHTFVLVGSILGLTQFGFFLTTAALPLYLRDLGAAQNRIGFEIGLGNLSALAATLVLGPAINRYGPQRFLRYGALLYMLTAMGMLLIQREVAVAAFRCLQGFGASLIGPSAFVLAAALLPRRQATAIGILGVMNNVALAAGPPVGLALYTTHGPGPLFLPSAVVAAAGFVALLFLPHLPAVKEGARGFGFDRSWIPSLIANTLAAAYFGGIVAYLPLYLQHVGGPNAGIFFTADALGVLLLRIPTGMLADRSGTFLPKLIGLIVTLPGIALLALPPSVPTLIGAGAGTGISAGLFITGVYADLSQLSSPANRGTAMSLASGTFQASLFAGSAISGLLIGPGGFNAVLAFGIVTCAAAIPFVFFPRGVRAAAS